MSLAMAEHDTALMGQLEAAGCAGRAQRTGEAPEATPAATRLEAHRPGFRQCDMLTQLLQEQHGARESRQVKSFHALHRLLLKRLPMPR